MSALDESARPARIEADRRVEMARTVARAILRSHPGAEGRRIARAVAAYATAIERGEMVSDARLLAEAVLDENAPEELDDARTTLNGGARRRSA